MADTSDRELITRWRKGEAEALALLEQRHRRPLYGYVYNMVRSRLQADDIYQEVWAKALRKMNTYRQQNFGGWLMRIARNLVIDAARKREADVSLDEKRNGAAAWHESIADNGRDAAETLAQRDAAEQIRALIQKLPTEQREVFLMRVEAELPFKDIARIQRVPLNTALARMQYAVRKLRTHLEEAP